MPAAAPQGTNNNNIDVKVNDIKFEPGESPQQIEVDLTKAPPVEDTRENLNRALNNAGQGQGSSRERGIITQGSGGGANEDGNQQGTAAQVPAEERISQPDGQRQGEPQEGNEQGQSQIEEGNPVQEGRDLTKGQVPPQEKQEKGDEKPSSKEGGEKKEGAGEEAKKPTMGERWDKAKDYAKNPRKLMDDGVEAAKDRIKTGITAAKAAIHAAYGNFVSAAADLAKLLKDPKALWNLVKGLSSGWKYAFIVLCIVGLSLEAAFGGGVLGGQGGVSGPTYSQALDKNVKGVLDETKKSAKLKSGSGQGQEISGFNNIKLSERDAAYLKNVFEKGKDGKNGVGFDLRLARVIRYLANKHAYIFVSHIVNTYEDMPIDMENSDKPQVMKNISAHKSGQAMDIREIDFVYKAVNPLSSCSDNPQDPRRDVLWFNDLGDTLLTQRCKGSILSLTKGGPIINGLPTEAIPIKIAWQDDPPGLAKSSLGTVRDAALGQMERAIGLPAGSLDSTKGVDLATQVGYAEIARQLGVKSDQIVGSNHEDILRNLGRTTIEDKLGLARGSLAGGSIKETVKEAGRAMLDAVFQQPIGSWEGKDLPTIAEASAEVMIQRELGLPMGIMEDPNQAKVYLAQRPIADEQIRIMAEQLGLPPEAVLGYVHDLQAGRINKDYAQTIGIRRLEKAWKLPAGTLDPYLQRIKTHNNSIALPAANLADLVQLDLNDLEMGLGYPVDFGTLSNIINKLGRGEDITQDINEIGKWQLSGALNVTKQDFDLYISGAKSTLSGLANIDLESEVGMIQKSIIENQQIDNYFQEQGRQLMYQKFADAKNIVGQTVGLAEDFRRQIAEDIKQGAKDLGMKILSQNLNMSRTELEKVMGGQLIDVSIIKNLDSPLGLDPGTFGRVLAGYSDPASLVKAGIGLGGGIGGLGGDEQEVMDKVYRPEAQRKVHQVIGELLDMPTELNDMTMRVTQLITFSNERDVLPFTAKLDAIYGKDRNNNYGLFYMKEAQPNIHIGY